MLNDLGDVGSRAMFGGHGIFHDGVMIGLIASGVFYLKVDDRNRHRSIQHFDMATSFRDRPLPVIQ